VGREYARNNNPAGGVGMADTYLMGRRTKITAPDWDESKYIQDVTINGKVVSVAEFRRRKRGKPGQRQVVEVRKGKEKPLTGEARGFKVD